MIPKESDGERFEEALARVCRCTGGGTATDNADSDSDVEVVAELFGVNLRCPVSPASEFVSCEVFFLSVYICMCARWLVWDFWHGVKSVFHCNRKD